ncbi:MAG: hypothetical protein WCD37_11955 [Chloroflexia bacterium]
MITSTSNILAEHLHRAAGAYRHGKRHRVSAGTSTAVGFDQLLGAAILKHASPREQMLMSAALVARTRGLAAVRKGDMEVAEANLRTSRDILEVPWLSTESHALLASFQEAAEAFIDFRCGRHDLARKRVFRAMSADGTLLSRDGYHVLELHRVQLGHNLARVDANAGEPERAARILAGLLTYLEGESVAWPFPDYTYTGKATVDDLPEEQVADLFIQLTSELALLLDGQGREEGLALFAPVVAHAELKATRRCGRHPSAHAWLSLKLAYLERNVVGFLEGAQEVLADGPREGSLLWYATATDLYRECARLLEDCPAEASSLRSELAEDAVSWIRVPAGLKAGAGVAVMKQPAPA